MTTEDWAKKIIEKELGLVVDVHDDGSESGMYDLRIGSKNAAKYAIECVGAVDSVATETWNIGPAKGTIKINSSGDWFVSINKFSRIKLLKNKIANIIAQCETIGLIGYTPVDWQLQRFNEQLFNELSALGITSIQRYQEAGNGNIHLSMDGDGDIVNQDAGDLIEWLQTFLSSNDRADVIKKLRTSNAKEKHVFIPIAFGGAPWNVASYFLGEMPAPCVIPQLPDPITGVWITLKGKGVRYANGKWYIFSY